jgi:predicted permease
MHIFQIIFPVFLIVVLGYLVSRYQPLDARTLSNLTIYLLTPALLFTQYLKNPIAPGTIFQIFIFAALLFFSLIGIAALVSRLLRLDSVSGHSFVLASVLINAGNMGIPIILFAFGDAGLAIAIIFLMINIIINATIGVFIAAGAHSNPVQAIQQIFLLPAIYTIAAGIFTQQMNLVLPQSILNPLTLLGEASIPVSLLLLGAQLSQTQFSQQVGPTLAASVIRLLLTPVIAFILTHFLNLTGLTQKVLILQTSMPTAVYAAILASKFQARPDFASGVILFSTLASAGTITILLIILT